MNVERMLELADILTGLNHNSPVKYDQSRWYRDDSCGTSACMAGIAILRWGSPEQINILQTGHFAQSRRPADPQTIIVIGGELLDLTKDQAIHLFCDQPGDLRNVEAADIIRDRVRLWTAG